MLWVETALLAGLVVVANRFGVLDAAGSVLAGLFGVVILWSVGPGWLALLVLFTGLGFVVTRLGYDRKRRSGASEPRHGRRGWRNVFANGLTATAVAALGFWVDPGRLVLPFAAAVAIAAADTFASEVGALSPRPVLVTRPRERVRPGTNGGVSWLGTGASVLGALLVAATAHVTVGLGLGHGLLVTAVGAAGSLFDSVLGATWEASPGHHEGPLNKQDVNLISISVPTLFLLGFSLVGLV